MDNNSVSKRNISSQKVKAIFKRRGMLITDNQAVQITDFVYSVAETLLGRDFIDPNELKKRVKNKRNRK